jgi:hypothetical protein
VYYVVLANIPTNTTNTTKNTAHSQCFFEKLAYL